MRLVEERIEQYADSLPVDRIARPCHEPSSHYLGHDGDTVAFFLTLDAINFGSGYFPHLRKRPGRSGYFTIATALTEHFAEKGALTAEELTELSVDDCMQLFGQDARNTPVRELMGHFADALSELGQYLLERFAGSCIDLVEEAGASTQRLIGLLAEMSHFRDVHVYRGVAVPLLKRAQIACADLAIAFDGRGPGRFTDLEKLTIFADNLVPHVLRCDGILSYANDLAAQIDRGEELAAGSPEEIEIRACAVHAVELVVKCLQQRGHDVMAMQVDNLLWNRGQQPCYKALARHRCRTVFY